MDPLSTASAITSIAVRVLAASFLVVMMFSLGLELGAAPKKDKREKRRGRRLLIRGLVVNLIVLPVVAFALVRLLHGSGAVATAILVVAATPGGRFAPRVAKIADADLGLAVEVTLFLAKLTGFTAPVTIRWLLGVPGIELHDLQLIVQLLVLQVGPYLAGRWLRRAHPAVAPSLRRPLLVAEAIVGIGFFALLVVRGDAGRLAGVSATAWVAATVFAVVALAVGWLVGAPNVEVRRALAVTASARNVALALVIAGERFGGAVQVAVFAIWLMCLVVDVAYAVAARGHRPSLQPA